MNHHNHKNATGDRRATSPVIIIIRMVCLTFQRLAASPQPPFVAQDITTSVITHLFSDGTRCHHT